MSFDAAAFRKRARAGERLGGTWLNLGSSITAEIAGRSGLDWVLVDLEHGVGNEGSLVPQLQGVMVGGDCASVVRVAANDPVRFKRVLDLGAHGVMVPWIRSVEEAEAAVEAVRYPPHGIRGAASITRATEFGYRPFAEYRRAAHGEVTLTIQIEHTGGLEAVDEIAALDGVDVLFVGPLDLSVSLGCPQDFEHPDFVSALKQVQASAVRHGKAAGILAMKVEHVRAWRDMGYSFMAMGSDGGMVAQRMRGVVETLAP